jgi:hypothetical protein
VMTPSPRLVNEFFLDQVHLAQVRMRVALDAQSF